MSNFYILLSAFEFDCILNKLDIAIVLPCYDAHSTTRKSDEVADTDLIYFCRPNLCEISKQNQQKLGDFEKSWLLL